MKYLYLLLILFSAFFLPGCNVPDEKISKSEFTDIPASQSEYEVSLEKTVNALNEIVSQVKKTVEVTQVLPSPIVEATSTPERFSSLCPDSFVYDDVLIKFLGWTLEGTQNLKINLSLESQSDQAKMDDDVYFFTMLNYEGRQIKESNDYCPNKIWTYPDLVDVFAHKKKSLKGNFCYLFDGSSLVELIFHEDKTKGIKEVCSWKIDLPEQ